jgi:hypothetical protein
MNDRSLPIGAVCGAKAGVGLHFLVSPRKRKEMATADNR